MISLVRSVLLICTLIFSHRISAQLTSSVLMATQDCSIAYTAGTVSNTTTLTSKVTTASTNFSRIFIQFNLSSIPVNAVIVSSKLSLTPTTTEDASALYLQRVTSSWSESSATANPTLTSTGQVTSSTLVSGKRVFDVKALTQLIVNSGAVNAGWAIRRGTETAATTGNTYYSSTGTTPPVLEIEWYVPYELTGAVVSHASSLSATDGAVTPTFIKGSTNTSFPTTYKWFKDDGTLISTSTASATLPGQAYGCYKFMAIGKYDTLFMAFLVGVKCEAVAITFTSDRNYADDAIITPFAAFNAGNAVTDVAQMANNVSLGWLNSNTLMRYYVWMDPSLLPLEAKLKLFGTGHNTSVRSNASDLILLTQAWKEMVVTDVTTPTSSTSIIAPLPVTTSANEDRITETRDFWNLWRANNLQNYGMRLQLQSSAKSATLMQFHSTETATAAKRPVINFRVDDATCDRGSYTLFKKEPDGNYATTSQGKLKFYFTEAYKPDAIKKIPLVLYDENHTIVAAIDINGSALPGKPLLPAFPYTFDDNRQVLDLLPYSLTTGKFYLLELTRTTGEKEYIQFIY